MKPYLITVGEPAGIGPDCIIRAYSKSPSTFDNSLVVAPSSWLNERSRKIEIKLRFKEFTSYDEASSYHPEDGEICCWNPAPHSDNTTIVTPGVPAASTADAVIECISSATMKCLDGSAKALITGPIEKAILKDQGFQFPGHTEFLAHLAREHQNTQENTVDFVMMLASDQLRVALLTTHIALSDVPAALSVQSTIEILKIVHQDLKHRFNTPHPKIGLCGLNPHAGEQGHFGNEEQEILKPAKRAAEALGIQVSDPMPADTLFSAGNRKNYDAIVCCYHDQALIPIKALSFGDAVNVTLGLPFVRTSVDHGTALDLVGKTSVSSSSLIAAIDMAREMNSCSC